MRETAGPSTALRSGRDDNSVAGVGHCSVAFVPAATDSASAILNREEGDGTLQWGRLIFHSALFPQYSNEIICFASPHKEKGALPQ